YLPGLPHARPTPTLQPDPAQRRGDPLPELPAHTLCDPRPLSRVGSGRECGAFRGQCGGRAAAGEASAAKLRSFGRTGRRAADASPQVTSDAPESLPRRLLPAAARRSRDEPGRTLAVRLRPETWSRVEPPEEVCKPDSVLPPRKREQQPFVWSPGCPGDRATD